MFIFSLSLTKKRQEERKGEGYATTPSGDTMMLSRKKLRESTTRDLLSWKDHKTAAILELCAKEKRRVEGDNDCYVTGSNPMKFLRNHGIK
jgi:hypothetical protein